MYSHSTLPKQINNWEVTLSLIIVMTLMSHLEMELKKHHLATSAQDQVNLP